MSADKKSDYLAGHFLLATPSMQDPRFKKSLIYICSHDRAGAMGLIINQSKSGLLKRLSNPN